MINSFDALTYFTCISLVSDGLLFGSSHNSIIILTIPCSMQFLDDVSFVAFACFNVLWATIYLENWKRRSSELAYLWGTLDKEDELITEPRPLFHVCKKYKISVI